MENELGEQISIIVKVSLPQATSAIKGKPGGEIDNLIILLGKESSQNRFMADEERSVIC